eukprot:TRINITY_DN15827_c0_g3_i2.p1 TRINITY_DN15827_c0_g3~~TRINITY_DN15827_c0_g3_i2.p1  ORF type:complete len:1243 (-),score=354.99 TRINITY_DN15827_c0_g3_i2:1599-5327(-)
MYRATLFGPVIAPSRKATALSEEEVKQIQAEFFVSDTDNDGVINSEQLHVVFVNLGLPYSKEDTEGIVHQISRNADEISYQQLMVFLRKVKESKGLKITRSRNLSSGSQVSSFSKSTSSRADHLPHVPTLVASFTKVGTEPEVVVVPSRNTLLDSPVLRKNSSVPLQLDSVKRSESGRATARETPKTSPDILKLVVEMDSGLDLILESIRENDRPLFVINLNNFQNHLSKVVDLFDKCYENELKLPSRELRKYIQPLRNNSHRLSYLTKSVKLTLDSDDLLDSNPLVCEMVTEARILITESWFFEIQTKSPLNPDVISILSGANQIMKRLVDQVNEYQKSTVILKKLSNLEKMVEEKEIFLKSLTREIYESEEKVRRLTRVPDQSEGISAVLTRVADQMKTDEEKGGGQHVDSIGLVSSLDRQSGHASLNLFNEGFVRICEVGVVNPEAIVPQQLLQQELVQEQGRSLQQRTQQTAQLQSPQEQPLPELLQHLAIQQSSLQLSQPQPSQEQQPPQQKHPQKALPLQQQLTSQKHLSQYELLKQELLEKEPLLEQEPLEQESLKQEPLKQEPIEQEPLEQESLKQEPLKQEPIEQEPLRQEPLEQGPLEQGPQVQEPHIQDPLKQEQLLQVLKHLPLKRETFGQEPSQIEPPQREPTQREPTQRDLFQREPLQREPLQEESTLQRDSPQQEPSHRKLSQQEPSQQKPSEQVPPQLQSSEHQLLQMSLQHSPQRQSSSPQSLEVPQDSFESLSQHRIEEQSWTYENTEQVRESSEGGSQNNMEGDVGESKACKREAEKKNEEGGNREEGMRSVRRERDWQEDEDVKGFVAWDRRENDVKSLRKGKKKGEGEERENITGEEKLSLEAGNEVVKWGTEVEKDQGEMAGNRRLEVDGGGWGTRKFDGTMRLNKLDLEKIVVVDPTKTRHSARGMGEYVRELETQSRKWSVLSRTDSYNTKPTEANPLLTDEEKMRGEVLAIQNRLEEAKLEFNRQSREMELQIKQMYQKKRKLTEELNVYVKKVTDKQSTLNSLTEAISANIKDIESLPLDSPRVSMAGCWKLSLEDKMKYEGLLRKEKDLMMRLEIVSAKEKELEEQTNNLGEETKNIKTLQIELADMKLQLEEKSQVINEKHSHLNIQAQQTFEREMDLERRESRVKECEERLSLQAHVLQEKENILIQDKENFRRRIEENEKKEEELLQLKSTLEVKEDELHMNSLAIHEQEEKNHSELILLQEAREIFQTGVK